MNKCTVLKDTTSLLFCRFFCRIWIQGGNCEVVFRILFRYQKGVILKGRMHTCSGLDSPLRVNQEELKSKSNVNEREYQLLEFRPRLLPEMLRLGEDRYRCQYCIPLNLWLTMPEVIFIAICMLYNNALRQCTTYSNRLFFVLDTSDLNKRHSVQRGKPPCYHLSFDAEKQKKIEEIVYQTCTGDLRKGHPARFSYWIMCLAADHHLCTTFKLTLCMEPCLQPCTMCQSTNSSLLAAWSEKKEFHQLDSCSMNWQKDHITGERAG